MPDNKICPRCVMDDTAAEITFNEEGYCNFCSDFLTHRDEKKTAEDRDAGELERLLAKIKEAGKNREYDCVLGVSGGLDSSYALYRAHQLGLRILAVHLDNGWNSELSVKNIEVMVSKLGIDLYTHVIDWEEFRDEQRAFFAANVVDIELLTDNAILAILDRMARKFKVKYVLTGYNMSNEGMRMPPAWNYYKLDARNIKAIYCRFGEQKKIRTLPVIGITQHFWSEKVLGIKWISLLDYVTYDGDVAKKVLSEKLAWKPYEKKHYESVFTRFYQGYILPRKFKVDKRKLHYSNCICTGQMTRDEALARLKDDPYEDMELLQQDKEYVLKKLGFSEEEFDRYLAAPAVPHTRYPSSNIAFNLLNWASILVKGRKTF